MCHCDSFFPLLETVPSAFCSPLLCHALSSLWDLGEISSQFAELASGNLLHHLVK